MTVALSQFLVLAAEVGDQPAKLAGKSGAPGNPLFQLLPFVLILVAFFWFMSRSQKKRDQKRSEERRVGKECRSRWSP